MTSFNPRRLNSSRSRIRSSSDSGQFVKALMSAIDAVLASQAPSSSLAYPASLTTSSSSVISGKRIDAMSSWKRNASSNSTR